MTKQFSKAGRRQSRCQICDHDLTVKGKKGADSDGRVYCSNPKCRYRKTPHPTGPSANAGPTSES